MAKPTIDEKLRKQIKNVKDFKNQKDESNNIINGLQSISDTFKKNQNFILQYDELVMEYMNSLDDLDLNGVSNKTKIEELIKVFSNLYEQVNKQTKESEYIKNVEKKNSKVIETKPIVTKPKEIKVQSNVKATTSKADNQNENMMISKFENIIKQENIQISNQLNTIETKVKTLAEDLEHNKTLINKSINEVQENLDPIKAISNKINKVNDSINNIEVGKAKKSKTDVPKDEQAIIELTQFMKDGLEQFENIATYYVTKQSEFEKSEKIQKELDSKIEEEKNKSFKEGELKSKIDMAKSIYNKFPNDFDKIKSVFEDIIEEKYEANDSIEITSENLQKLEVEIEGIKEIGAYIIKTPALLIGEEVLIRATVEMSK